MPFVALTLVLIFASVPARERGLARPRLDWLGAVLTFFGLAGPVLALIRQPMVGWSSPQVWGAGLAGVVLLALFLVHEHRTPAPMLPLEPLQAPQLRRRQPADVHDVRRASSVTFFFLVLFLQQVAGYDALEAGFALMPATLVMFVLSKRVGRLADRFGPAALHGRRPADRPRRAWR